MKKTIFIGGISIGLLLILTSYFAEQIGLDNDAGWGTGRLLILKAGIGFLSASILGFLFKEKLPILGQTILKPINKFNTLHYSARMAFFALPAVIVVIASYIWLALPAFQTTPEFKYYSSLAIAFKMGQLYLVEEPSPELLALENPYDNGLRTNSGVNFPWDVSLYKNKFYLYWGPIPSVVLMLFSMDTLSGLGDYHIVLAFMSALFFYYAAFCRSIWLRYNQTLPPWLFGMVLLTIGLSAPATLMFNSSRIYEAAVVACQFFFIGGCYWIFSYFGDTTPRPYKIILTGIHWALALGTRVTILPVLIFTTGMTLFNVFKQTKPFSLKSYLPNILRLCLPLAFIGVGLMGYNWIRFDSVSEFGITYQLAIIDYTVFKESFSTGHIKENFVNYFFHPVNFLRQFPYIQPIENTFSNERLAGLTYTSPYVLFAFLFIGKFALKSKTSTDQHTDVLQRWLMLTLAGSALIAMLTFLLYYFPATRFAHEFMPALLLLATLSLGQGLLTFEKNRIAGRLYIFFVTLVAAYTAIASVLIAIPPYRAKFVIVFIRQIYEFLGLR